MPAAAWVAVWLLSTAVVQGHAGKWSLRVDQMACLAADVTASMDVVNLSLSPCKPCTGHVAVLSLHIGVAAGMLPLSCP